MKKDLSIECLELLCRIYPDDRYINTILDSKIIPNDKCIDNLCLYALEYCFNGDIIENFIKYGYMVSQERFLYLVNHRIFLKDPIHYGLQVTEPILQKYIKICYIPPNCSKMLSKENHLAMLFNKKNNMSKIKKFIKIEKIKPDIECLRNACKIHCRQYIKFLIEKCNLKTDGYCLKQFMNKLPQIVKLLVDTFEN